MLNRANLGDGQEIPVAVDEERVVPASELCDAATISKPGARHPPAVSGFNEGSASPDGTLCRASAGTAAETCENRAPAVHTATQPFQGGRE